MKNCHGDIVAYHNEEVTLPNRERKEMRERRDSNRRRLRQGLERDGEPRPVDYRSQGSYAMRTMVQQPDKDYDVDDGVYFNQEQLKGPRGGERSAAEVREMIHKALHDGSFERPPEKLKHCIRVYYKAGYHVDVPAYRRIVEEDIRGNKKHYVQLASTEWKISDPLAVTEWFLDANKTKSPDDDNGGQLRRVARLLKAFARSRPSWRERIATGFMITKLVVEKYVADADREDRALYGTMAAIRDRLHRDLEIEHPTVAGEMLTKGPDDSQARFLREKLDWAIDELGVLSRWGCSREQALKAWDKTFDTTFFSDRLEATSAGVTAGLLMEGSEKAAAERPVDKRGGGRYA